VNQNLLTLKNCESYLYDAEVYKRHQGRDLQELFVNSPDLLPQKHHEHLSLYKIENETLIYEGVSPVDFSRQMKTLDVSECFVILLEDEYGECVYYLVSLKADFLVWDKAIIVRKDIETGENIIDFVSKNSDFMSETYFKRFFVNFPFFLLEHGVKAAYPILAKS